MDGLVSVPEGNNRNHGFDHALAEPLIIPPIGVLLRPIGPYCC